MKKNNFYHVHFSNDDWYGHNTFHLTKRSAKLLYRAYIIMSLVHDNVTDPRVAELEAMSEDELHQLYEDELGGMGFDEQVTPMNLMTLQEAYNMVV